MAELDISTIIKEKIKNYKKEIRKTSEGKVISVSDGIANLVGIEDTMLSELLLFPNNVYGMALSLEEDMIGAILLGEYSSVNQGDKVLRTGKITSVPVGDELLGRVVNSLGEAVDGKGAIKTKTRRETELVAPGIMTRESVSEPLETGILAIDSMIPIGKGQRELIIGDRKTGKTAIVIDTIINQKGKNVKCVYVSIGQKNSTLAVTAQKLIAHGAMDYTTIVSANSSDSDAMQFIAPYAGIAIAEEWMSKGDDVLIVFDDLSKHAVAYRTISLLLRRPPGREAYPGDVFYLHSKLLERAAKLNKKYGGGSITALPIIETQAGDISAYIPTNVISITDGQIFLMTDAFNSGQRPAVDSGFSVSRVGSAAQTSLIKQLSSALKLQLASYEEMKSFSEFASDLDAETKEILETGEKVMEILKQPQYSPYSMQEQAMFLFLINENMLSSLQLSEMKKFKEEFLKEIHSSKSFKFYMDVMKNGEKLVDSSKDKLKKQLTSFIERFK
ncbi:MAG: ATP synthase subunit alpha [Candidatus Hepatoplasma vulgare]|nr:MAG: ATP synthase subunit alpha [Candidatus Hepatoplasma sp.]